MLNILKCTFYFCYADKILNYFNINGIYYFLHFVTNLYIVYNTFDHVILCYTNLYDNLHVKFSYDCMDMITALHLYHIAMYKNKFRIDDWLHHILMIFIAVPLIRVYAKCGILISHGLFFTTGLPGGIDYLLLFLNRNNLYVTRRIEKKVNTFLNNWIRCPGCIVTATLILNLLQIYKNFLNTNQFIASVCVMIILYWNGIYFMQGVNRDYYTKYYVKL